MMPYCSTFDLKKIRADIMGHGVSSWSDQIGLADEQINLTLARSWYRGVAADMDITDGFDPEKITDAGQLRMAACYLTLSLIYQSLASNTDVTGNTFFQQAELYSGKYEDEINAVLEAGIDYDFPGTANDAAETRRRPRRLVLALA